MASIKNDKALRLQRYRRLARKLPYRVRGSVQARNRESAKVLAVFRDERAAANATIDKEWN